MFEVFNRVRTYDTEKRIDPARWIWETVVPPRPPKPRTENEIGGSTRDYENG